MERNKDIGLSGTRRPSVEGSAPMNTLVVRQDGRKPLFGNRNNAFTAPPKEKATESTAATNGNRAPLSSWRTQSDPQIETKQTASPGATRIPQPKTATPFSPPGNHPRRSLTMTEAMNLAQNEHEDGAASDQVMDASPSPAPRKKFDLTARTKSESLEPIGSESPARRNWRNRAAGDARKIGERDGLAGEPDIPGLVPGIEDVPLPSVEGASKHAQAFKAESPMKSFAWDIDDEFTAGDLQVSNSPRLKTARPFANRLPVNDNSNIEVDSKARLNPGSQNTKLDRIRAREAQAIESHSLLDRSSDRSTGTPKFRKLDEIRAREKKAAEEIPIPDRNAPRPRNTKLDQIQQRELAGIPPRDQARGKLNDIKERNAQSSRSPEEAKPRAHLERKNSTSNSRIPFRSRNDIGDAGEKVDGTPVTIYRGSDRAGATASLDPTANKFRPITGAGLEREKEKEQGKGSEAQEWIRRLARATSGSPAPAAPSRPQTSPARTDFRPRQTQTQTQQTQRGSSHRSAFHNKNKYNGNGRLDQLRNNARPGSRPAIGDVRRVRSAESMDSKRSSMHSEADPTERILGEQELFKPTDYYPERPVSSGSEEEDEDEDDVEATPVAKTKLDPLSMPTPRVTGAYVETPATVRTVKFGNDDVGTAQMLKERTPSFARRNQNRDLFSDPEEEPRPAARPRPTTTTRRPRRHSHSISSTRPPLLNSAILPNVKDDLRQLQQLHNIEDSTMDDLDDIIYGRKPPVSQIESVLQEAQRMSENALEDEAVKAESSEEPNGVDNLDDTTLQPEIAKPGALDRLLLSVRDSNRGISRLARKIDEKPNPPPGLQPHTIKAEPGAHPHIYISTDNAFYIHVPVPRLYRLNPLRLTWLGLLVLPALIWFALETAMCALYCRPETCSTDPCIFSIHDPTFGFALPVKIDQWVTGGRGRLYASLGLEETHDWVADMVDLATGRNIQEVDTKWMDAGAKKVHRRRLRKKGLLGPAWTAGREQKEKMEAWRQERLARERVQEARARDPSDWDWDDSSSIGGDKRVW